MELFYGYLILVETLNLHTSSRRVTDIFANFSTKFGFCQHIFIKVSNIKFKGNMSGGNRSDTCGRTDVTKMLWIFSDFATAPCDLCHFTSDKIAVDASRHTSWLVRAKAQFRWRNSVAKKTLLFQSLFILVAAHVVPTGTLRLPWLRFSALFPRL